MCVRERERESTHTPQSSFPSVGLFVPPPPPCAYQRNVVRSRHGRQVSHTRASAATTDRPEASAAIYRPHALPSSACVAAVCSTALRWLRIGQLQRRVEGGGREEGQGEREREEGQGEREREGERRTRPPTVLFPHLLPPSPPPASDKPQAHTHICFTERLSTLSLSKRAALRRTLLFACARGLYAVESL